MSWSAARAFWLVLQLQTKLNAGICHLQDEIYFNCQNCSQIGYGPFELNKALGFQLTIRHTKSDYSKACCAIHCKAACIGCSVQHASHKPFSFGRGCLASCCNCLVLHCQVKCIADVHLGRRDLLYKSGTNLSIPAWRICRPFGSSIASHIARHTDQTWQ